MITKSSRGNASYRPWMDTVKEGDVLINSNGTDRIVRKVGRHKDGSLRSINFSIMHCSWTTRAYTTYHQTDLVTLGYEPLNVSIPLNSKLDRKIAAAIKNWNLPPERSIQCCAVAGIVR